jgi:two-component SAPR family response regulator
VTSRVLVVDDNRDLADGIAMLLREAALDVGVAYSGVSALTEMETDPSDLVLTDVRMPGMDGMELLAAVRERWPSTKVVVITAHGSIDAAVQAMKRGAADYITKPFENVSLVETVRRNLLRVNPEGEFDTAAIVAEVSALVSPDDLLPSLGRALDALLRATGADDAEVFLLEPDGKDALLTVAAGTDTEALASRTRFEPNLGYPGIVAVTGEPVVIAGTLDQDTRFLRRAVHESGLRSTVCVPLLGPQGPLGSLHILARSTDFPVDRIAEVLKQAAVPIANAIRAGLSALREGMDQALDDESQGISQQLLRSILFSIVRVGGATSGTLVLVDPETSQSGQRVSTGPAAQPCANAEAGCFEACQPLLDGHARVGGLGRRTWPDECRRGLPQRMASPCCLPLVAGGRFHGLVTLDFGQGFAGDPTGRLVPLLTMAHQAAVRLQAHQPGRRTDRGSTAQSEPPRASAELEIRCLGPFRILRGGQAVAGEAFARRQALILLKLLALKEGTPLTRDFLVEQLWPGVDARSGANRLHGVVHALRSVIEPFKAERRWVYVHNRGDLYYLDLDASVRIDLMDFRKHAQRGLRAGATAPEETIRELEAAAALYGGDLFEEDPYADWCAGERRELAEVHVRVLNRLSQLYSERGDAEKAVESLQEALRHAPLREDLVQTLSDLFTALGRPADAAELEKDYQRRLEALE